MANMSTLIIKCNELSADPWCNPTSIFKYWVAPQRVFTLVFVALYIILDDDYICLRYVPCSECPPN